MELAEKARTALSSDTVVELSAYAIDGPRLPLARKVLPAARWPIDFALTDADAVNPAFTLSKAVQVVLVARVGSAPAAGSGGALLEGRSMPVASGSADLIVVVDRQPSRP